MRRASARSRARCVRGAAGRQASVARPGHCFPNAAARWRRNSVSAAAPLKNTCPMRGTARQQRADVVRLDAARIDVRIEAARPQAAVHHVPQRHAVAAQHRQAARVRGGNSQTENGGHQRPEGIGRVGVVAPRGQRGGARHRTEHQHARRRGRATGGRPVSTALAVAARFIRSAPGNTGARGMRRRRRTRAVAHRSTPRASPNRCVRRRTWAAHASTAASSVASLGIDHTGGRAPPRHSPPARNHSRRRHVLASGQPRAAAAAAGRTNRSPRHRAWLPCSLPRRRRLRAAARERSNTLASAAPVCESARARRRGSGRALRPRCVRPPAPPSGPRSMIQSASAITSRLCSITTPCCRASTSRCSTRISFSTSAMCRPIGGLVQQVQRLRRAGRGAASAAHARQLGHQLDALRLAAAQRRALLAQAQVAQSHFLQQLAARGASPGARRRTPPPPPRSWPARRRCSCSRKRTASVSGVEARAAAGLAEHRHVGQEAHLDRAARPWPSQASQRPAGGIEREAARRV